MAFLLTSIVLLILPGYLLAVLLGPNLPWFQRLPTAFSLSLALLGIPAVLLLNLHAPLALLGWLALALILILTIATIWRRSESWKLNWQSLRPNLKSLLASPLFLACLAAVGFVLYLFIKTATVRDFGDHWFYLHFIRHYLDFPLDPALNPLAGQDVSPGTLSRSAINGWWVIQALLVQVSGTPLLEAYWFFLPPILMIGSLFAFHALAWELFQRREVALTAVLLQLLLYLTTISSHDWIGQGFFTRIVEDKYLVWLVLLPVALMLLLRYAKTGQRPLLFLLGGAVAGIAITHPFGLLQFAFAVACFAVVHLLLSWKENSKLKTAVLLAPILLFLIIPIIQFFFSNSSPLTQFYPNEIQSLPNDTHLIVQAADNYRYLVHPHPIFHPLILLSILLTPLLFLQIRRQITAQFLAATTILPVLLLYNPITAPLLGRFLSPLLLWRTLWILPTALTLAYCLNESVSLIQRRLGRANANRRLASGSMLTPLLIIFGLALLLWNYTADSLDLLDDYQTRTVTESQQSLLNYLCQETELTGIVLADPTLNTLLPACASQAQLLTYRIFLAQPDAAEEIDRFYNSSQVTPANISFLEIWQVNYLIIPNQTPIAAQIGRLSNSFTEQFSNTAYSLYEYTGASSPIIQGNDALIRGDWLTAETAYQQAITDQDSIALAYFGLGKVALAQGQTAAAQTILQQAIEADPTYPAPSIALAALYRQDGRLDEAQTLLTQALLINPNSLLLHQTLGDLFLELGDETAAVEQYQQALNPTPNPNDQLLAFGKLLQEKGLTEQAITTYEEVINTESDLFRLSGGPGFWPVWSRSLTFDRRPQRLETAFLALGQIYEVQGKSDSAETTYRQLIRLLPTKENGYRTLATLLTNTNRSTDTIALYQEASHLNFHLAWPYLGLAQAYLNQYQTANTPPANLEKAIAALQTAQQINPENIESYHLLAQTYRLNNQPQAIEALYASPAARYHWAAWPLVTLGQYYLDKGDFAAAESALKEAISRQPTEQTAYNLLAEAHISRQETAEAQQIYQQAITANPDRAWPHLGLGNAYLAAGNSTLALATYQDGLAWEPDNPAVYSTLGNIYRWNVGDLDTAVSYFRQSLTLDPTNEDVQMAFGAVLVSTGQETAGLVYIEQALVAPSQSASRFQMAGDIMWQIANTDLAQQYYQQALYLEPQNAFAHLGLSRIYRQQQQYDLALEHAQQAILHASTVHVTGPAEQEQAQIYQALGQPDEALPHLLAAAEALPTNPWFQAALGDFYHYQQNDPAQAVAYYQKAAELAPQQAILQAALGTALYDAGQIQDALPYMEQAVTLDRTNPAIFLRIGSVFLASGDWTRLVQFYETAVANNIQNPDIYNQLGQAYSALGQDDLALVQYQKASELRGQ